MSDQTKRKAQCPNGHFYNALRYESCPYCARMNASAGDGENEAQSASPAKEEPLPERVPEPEALPDKPDGAAGKTEQEAASNEDVRTVSFYSDDSVDPVVGWLVCIKGKHYAEVFSLFAGRNEIGRDSSKDISLYDEPSISKKTHAVVIFEPRHRKFYLQAGDSHGLTYLDGEIVVSYKQMDSGCIVTLGEVAFKFVALCGEDFDWSETENYVTF